MQPGKPTRPETVLVVEDNVPSQKVLQGLLRARGLQVRLAANGEEALASIAAQRPDLVLLDCLMPVLDGYQTLLRLRALEAQQGGEAHLPVVAITANALQRDLQRCSDCGADAVLTKPVMLDELDRILADWLGVTPPAATPPTPTVAEAPLQVLDCRNLDALRATVSATDLAALLSRFDSSQGELLEEVRGALAARDAPALVGALHGFKGGAAYIGAGQLPALCATLEALARSGRIDAVAEQLTALTAAHRELQQALAAYRTAVLTRPARAD